MGFNLKKFVAPADYEADEKSHLARLIYITSHTILGLSILYVLSTLGQSNWIHTLLVVGLLDLIEIGILILVHRGWIQQAGLLQILSIWAFVSLAVLTSGGMHSGGLVGYSVVIVLAGLLLATESRWAVPAFTALCIGSSGLILLLQEAGRLPPSLAGPGPSQPLSIWTTHFATYALMAVLLQLAVRNLQQALDQARQNQQALQQSEARTRMLLEAMPDMLFELKSSGQVLDFFPSPAEAPGLPPEQFIGKNISEVLPEELARKGIELLQQAVQNNNSRRLEYYDPYLDGDFEARLIPSGADRILAIVRNVSKRKQAQQALQKSEEQYRSTIEAMGDAIHVVDRDLRIQLFNQAFRQWNAWLELPQDVIGRPLNEVFPFLPEQVYAEYRQVLESGHILFTEESTVLQGREWVTETRKIPILEEGQVVRIVTVVRDITERKRAEAALRESEARLRTAMENLPFEFFALDQEGRYVMQNSVCREHWGDAIGKRPQEVAPDEDTLELWLENNRRALAGEIIEEEITLQIEGQPVHYYNILSPIYESGQIRGILGVNVDVSELKQAQQALQRSNERLRALRQIDQAILSTQSPESIVQAALSRIRQIIPCQRASVVEFDPQRRSFTILTAKAKAETRLSQGRQFDLEEFRPSESLLKGQIHTVKDIGQLDNPAEIERILLQEGVQAYVNFPLIAQGELIGSLNLGLAEPGFLDPAEQDVAQEIADSLSTALQNARLLQQERQRSAELEILRQASLQLTSSLELQPVLEAILEQTLGLTTADDAHIFLYDGTRLSFGAALLLEGFQQHPYSEPRPHGITYSVAQSGQSIVVTDMSEHALFQDVSWTGAIASLPLRIGNRVVGVMNIAFDQPHRFLQTELRVLELLADQAAIAVVNARLHERVRQYANELEQRVQERTAELRTSEERARAQYKAIPVPTYTWEQQGSDFVLIDYNDAARTITQGQIDRFVGIKAGELYKDDPQILAELQRCLDEQVSIERELLYPFQSTGEQRHLAVKYAFVPPKQVLVHTEDISERKQAEQEIQKRSQQLEAVNRELEAFSYSVSHDLRAPLFSIQGFVQALQEDYGPKLEESGSHYLERIRNAATRMDALIQDLLAYSRIGRDQILLEPISLEGVLSEIRSLLDATIEQQGAEIAVESPLPSVVGQRSILVQVISNLVSNALKFVAPGTRPQVRIWAQEAQDTVRLWVEDNGIGIDPQDQERIFQVFERLHSFEHYPGTGIGLAIVRKGIERLRGRVGLDSGPGQGSRFWIELPSIRLYDRPEQTADLWPDPPVET
ncbi:MAG: PAS domain-containing protein [Chloroflexia bacterium]|nr:PAS domain-containing protein [Chloroflexia bacterium]